MFEQVFENLKKITEANTKAQQELFKKWVAAWPGVAGNPPVFGEQFQQAPKQWAETVQNLLKKQREYLETQFKAGLANIEKAFAVGEAKTAEELKAKTLELWKKCFESLWQGYESQFKELQAAIEKCSEYFAACGV